MTFKMHFVYSLINDGSIRVFKKTGIALIGKFKKQDNIQ